MSYMDQLRNSGMYETMKDLETDEMEAQFAADKFNNEFAVGETVMLKKDFIDTPIRTKITSKAYEMCGSVVVMLEGVSGAYAIRCVAKSDESKGG